MNTWLIALIVAAAGIIISLFFEEARDFWAEQLEGLFEGLIYFFSFQWLNDIPDFFSEMFDNLSEFSPVGIGFGAAGVILIYVLRDSVLKPFTEPMNAGGEIFWTIVTFLGVFIGLYLLGKRFENTA